MDNIKRQAEGLSEQAKEKLGDAQEAVSSQAEGLVDQAKDQAETVIDNVKDRFTK
ncbi:MAG TPA: CsbD family protein [Beutenbergiaceae bacterium]|nr:CsbD family protein [Beutenbergiaceae bacterium]